jgi:hypothetical protein
MKFLFRLIGILVVLLVLVMAVLCYLDTKGLLSGKLEHLIGTLRILGQEAWAEIRLFMSDSGIAEDAAGLLDQGAAYLRDGVSPHGQARRVCPGNGHPGGLRALCHRHPGRIRHPCAYGHPCAHSVTGAYRLSLPRSYSHPLHHYGRLI